MGWLGGGDERLWIFDPKKDIAVGEAFEPIAYIGPTLLSLAFDGRDRVYFVQYKDLSDGRTHWTEAVREYPREHIPFEDDLHLRSVGIGPSSRHQLIDHGKIVDQKGRHLTMIEALAADNKGNVFMLGSWDALGPQEASHQFFWPELTQYYIELGYPAVAKTYKDAKNYEHKVMNRGQFFSYVHVSQEKGSE